MRPVCAQFTARGAGLKAAPVPVLVGRDCSTCHSIAASAPLWQTSTRLCRPSSVPSYNRPFAWRYISAFKKYICVNNFFNENNFNFYSLHRNFGTAQSGQRSPHVVLQVSASASKSEIKAAFRKLAKQHHPDLKIHQNDDEDRGDDIMTDLITAYEALMNKHSENFWTDARDSRVALACEMYTIEELRSMHYVFDIYLFRVVFSGCDNADATKLSKPKENESTEDGSTVGKIDNDDRQHLHLDPTPIVPLKAHPDDSISDLKRHMQSCYAESWGLGDRRTDRDGLYLGWELVHSCNDDDRKDNGDGSVLSYHLFLHSYGIQEGDILHAVVRKNK